MMKNYEEEYEQQKISKKIISSMQMIYNTSKFYCNIMPNIFYTPDKNKAQILSLKLQSNKNNTYDKIKWKNNSEGLIIVIHGLLGSPKTLGYEIAKKIYTKTKKTYDVILPIVPFGGNCSLQNAGTPLYDVLLNYIEENPNKPISIISCSNGCRIASWIEYKLRDKNVNIKLICIAGAFNGSSMIDKFKLFLSLFLNENIITDLSTNSKVNNELIQNINSHINVGSRYYEFYGTANDWYIPNINSCFPILDKVNCQIIYHELKYGYDHVSLGWYLSDEITNNCLEWFDKIIYS